MTRAAELLSARAIAWNRVEEAWGVLRRMPDRERQQLAKGERGQKWPAMIYSAAEHAAWMKAKTRLPPPSPEQIDKMNEVIDWLVALAKQDRNFGKAVWLCCALRMKPAEAGRLLGCHRDTARAWRDNGLDRIAGQFLLKAA
jgi:hypothetical protein